MFRNNKSKQYFLNILYNRLHNIDGILHLLLSVIGMTFENSIIVRVCCIFKDYHVAILFQFFYEACLSSLNDNGPVNINLISLGKNYTIHHLSAPTKQQHLP